MSAIQLLESLAQNATYKSQLLAAESPSGLTIRAQTQIEDLLEHQTKIWCVFLPAEDDVPADDEDESNDDDETKNSMKN